MANLQWPNYEAQGAGYGTPGPYQGSYAQNLIPLDDSYPEANLSLLGSQAEGQVPLNEVRPQYQATQNGFGQQALLGQASFHGGSGPAHPSAGAPAYDLNQGLDLTDDFLTLDPSEYAQQQQPQQQQPPQQYWSSHPPLAPQQAFLDQSAFPQQQAWGSQPSLQVPLQQASFQQQQQQQPPQQYWSSHPPLAPQQAFLDQSAIPQQQAWGSQPSLPLQQVSFQQQPQQQQQQPQQPQLSFEQKRAQFRQVPPLQADPHRKPGSGRPKKPQRFWAPGNANDTLKGAYKELQVREHRVSTAEKHLAEETNPAKVTHCEKMVLKNMRLRQEQWEECERLERAQPATVLPLLTAEDNWKKAYADMKSQQDRYETTYLELAAANQELVKEDNTIDMALLRKEDKKSYEGLQTKLNWLGHKTRTLVKCFEVLVAAQHAAYGEVRTKADIHGRVKRMHEIGGEEMWILWFWLGDSQLHRDLRKEFSNRNSNTWGTSGPWHDNCPVPDAQVQGEQETEPATKGEAFRDLDTVSEIDFREEAERQILEWPEEERSRDLDTVSEIDFREEAERQILEFAEEDETNELIPLDLPSAPALIEDQVDEEREAEATTDVPSDPEPSANGRIDPAVELFPSFFGDDSAPVLSPARFKYKPVLGNLFPLFGGHQD